MTAIAPGTYLVVGEAFTDTIPAGTPFVIVNGSHMVTATYPNGLHEPVPHISPNHPHTTRHRLTTHAPVPTPDEFQPVSIGWVQIRRDGDGRWLDPNGDAFEHADDVEVRHWIANGFARLTHVPDHPTMTREQAEQIVADAPADVRAAVEVLCGGGEA